MSDSIFGANSYLGGSWDALKRLPAGVLRHLSDNPEQMARGVLGPAYKPTMALANIMGPQADVAGMVRDAGGVIPALERGQYGTAAGNLGLAAAAIPFMFLPGSVTAFKGAPAYTGGLTTKGMNQEIINRVPLKEIRDLNPPHQPHAGFYSDDPAVASRFARAYTAPEIPGATFDDYIGGAVHAVDIDIKKPLTINMRGKPAAAFQFEGVAKEHGTMKELRAYEDALKNDAYDGIIIKNTRDEGTVFIPKNAASVKNRFAQPTKKPKPRGKTREEIEIQGGALKSNVGEHLGRILDDHNIEWSYHENGGITAIEEYTDKLGRAGRSKKYFSPNASLGTVRNWLGY